MWIARAIAGRGSEMPVRSGPLPFNGSRQREEASEAAEDALFESLLASSAGQPATISRAKLRRQRAWVTWYGAWALLFLGWLGTLVATNGGWGNVLAGRITLTGTILAIVSQAILTWIQWSWSDHLIAAYISRALDAGLTALGYGSLVIAGMAAWFAAQGIPATIVVRDWTLTGLLAWFILWLIALFPAWYPEHRLIR